MKASALIGCFALAFLLPCIGLADEDEKLFIVDLPAPGEPNHQVVDVDTILIPKCETGDDIWYRKLGQIFATIVTSPIGCTQALCTYTLSGHQTRVPESLLKICAESMLSWVGNHIYSWYSNISTEKFRNCGEDTRIVTDYETIPPTICFEGHRKGMGLCALPEGEVRPNSDCSAVTSPGGMDQKRFLAQYKCLAEKLAVYWDYNWDLFKSNCGSISTFPVECLGGTVVEPGKLNLGIGCNWEKGEFRRYSDEEPGPISGKDLCEKLKQQCTCDPVT